ncbi:MAG: glutathione synthase [Legionellales bacterium]|nr:glutathione synthase [Legionellales bacterium]|tara:strand:+ start:3326 stop:4273 length:948 start_codon:yes stop_codon:yes gene_type:complete
MSIKLGIVMDPIQNITIHKDSSFAMLLEAQSRGWELHYMEAKDLFLANGQVQASMQRLQVDDNTQQWFQLSEQQTSPLHKLDVILMRKDPPFDIDYIFTTYLLELAEQQGCLVLNKPQSLRDANEKLFTAWFPQCCPSTLVSSSEERIRDFIDEHGDIILKPLEGMGGASIFRVKQGDLNTSVIIETLTHHGQRNIMAQVFIPEISDGDKRILMINGEPVPYALARIPAKGELRGNLAAGGTGKGIPLSDKDRWICQQVGPTLKAKGLIFVGLDVIGDYLTEINVTSPTCIRELDKAFDLNICQQLFDVIEEKLS